jgi:hypothetical protein
MDAPLPDVEAALVEHFGSQPARASVSFVGVDPIEILRFEPVPGERAYVSLGMARHPMTGAGETVRAEHGPRAELVLHVHDPTDAHADVWRSLAVLAAAPAVEGVVYVPGMTVDLGSPVAPGSRCSGIVTAESSVPAVPFERGDVHILRVIPATAQEIAWCRVHGAEALVQRWQERAVDLYDLTRSGVELG